MNTRLLVTTFTFVYSLFITIQTHAAVVQYDESFDGDLVPPQFIGTFDVGINTVTGSSSWPDAGDLDIDTFEFDVPAGLVITSGQLSFSFTSSGQISFGLIYLDTLSNFGFLIVDSSDTSPITLYASDMPLGSGSYRMLHPENARKSPGSSLTYDYTLQFEVSAVPVPAAVWLFGSGLLGLIGIPRRKKAA